MKKLILSIVSLFILAGCADNYYDDAKPEIYACQGIGCASKDPYDKGLSKHKPSKEEKTRVMQGQQPDFGVEKSTIGIRGTW